MLNLRIIIILLMIILPMEDFADQKESQRLIKVLGCSESEKLVDVRARVDFYLDYLEIKQDLLVLITFVDFTPQNSQHKYDLLGTTIPTTFQGKPMIHILIEESAPYYKQMLVLAHEMVHLKQFVTGELVEHNEEHFTWKGTDFYHVRDIEYKRRGWEREALNLQSKLHSGYKKFQKSKQNLLVNNTSNSSNTL